MHSLCFNRALYFVLGSLCIICQEFPDIYLQSSRAKDTFWWDSTLISMHPSNLDWHHAFQACSLLLRKHKTYPELFEEIVLPEARHSPVRHLQQQQQALLLTMKTPLLYSGSTQHLTNLETFVSDWMLRKEPIRGVCQGSNNHETTHCGRHSVAILGLKQQKKTAVFFPVCVMTWFLFYEKKNPLQLLIYCGLYMPCT